jgi:hypothetical protein
VLGRGARRTILLALLVATLVATSSTDGAAAPRLQAVGEGNNPAEPVSVHIVAGQSNAVGSLTDAADLPPSPLDSQVGFYWIHHSYSGHIVTLQPQDTSFLEGVDLGFGPEMTLGRQLADQTTRTALIVKVAFGQTSLAQSWRPGDGSMWGLLQSSLDEVFKELEDAGLSCSVDGFYWVQGEADMVEPFAAAYEQNLDAFIDALRAEPAIGRVPFVIARSGNPVSSNGPEVREAVRTAQTDVARRTPATWWVDTDDLTSTDEIHDDGPGQVVLGERLFGQIAPLVGAADPPEHGWSDGVPASQQAAVDWADSTNTGSGFGDGTIRAGAQITRSAAMTYLWRFEVEPPAQGASTFTDIPSEGAFAEPVAWAAEEGITSGYAGGTFGPARTVTRFQAVTFLHRLAGSPEPDRPAPFPDAPASGAAAAAVAWASEHGITTGFPDGTFRPGAAVTRGAFLTFLHRLASDAGAWDDPSDAPATAVFG